MDVQKTIRKARYALKPVSGADLTTRVMLQELAKMPEAHQKSCFISDRQGGFVFLFQSDTAGRYVLEVVQAGHGQDNVVALYAPDALLNDRSKLMALRIELIEALERVNDAAPGTVRAFDHQRGRQVLLGELSTVQLADMLESRQLARDAESSKIQVAK